jgi:probable HAF family extracellular repeat protein
MWYPSLLRGPIPGLAGAGRIHRRPARRKLAACRLHLEPLEERWCPTYSVTDLGTLGGTTSYAYAINSANHVVGQAQAVNKISYAFFYNGGMTNLGTEPGDVYSRALAINDYDQVVGYSGSGVNVAVSHAFMWQGPAGPMTDLGNIGSSSNTTARAINNAGQAVGDGYTAAGVDHAWFWQSNTMTDLNNEPGVEGSGWVLTQAWGINGQGQIVGQGTHNGQTRAFLWTWKSGVPPTDLGALVAGGDSLGTAINSSGQVAGTSYTAGGCCNGFYWTSTDGMTDLPPLRKDVTAYAYALNDLSPVPAQVVGYSNSGGGFHAVLWQNGKAIDLTGQQPKGSNWTLEFAYGINNGGYIVGEGQGGLGQRAVLLTPSGTPSTAVAALPTSAILSSSSIAPSSPVVAPAPNLVSATVPDPAPTGGHNQTPPVSVATSDRGGPSMLSASRAIQPDRWALEVRDCAFAAFADELVPAWF